MRMRELAKGQPGAEPGATTKPLAKTELLRPELRFTPQKGWLLLPEMARQLGTDDAQQAALREVLEAGVEAVRTALAAEGADKDVGAAAALFVTQLWQFVREVELPEAHLDALHAQIVATLATPEVAKMSDADKQRFWEFTVGFPILIAGLAELAEGDPQLTAVRQAADRGFEALLGVTSGQVDIGANGLTLRATGTLATPPGDLQKGGPSAAAIPSTGPAISGVTYTPPAGWARETSQGNVIFRATLGDVDDQGKPYPNSSASHQATIGFLPVLKATQGPTALFNQTWRDQFGTFELGDTLVHYRSRLPSGLVLLYMGRFFTRPNAPAAEGNPKTYGVLYLIDLGDNRFQPLVAVVEPRSADIGMDMFKEKAALKALSFPLGALLESVRPDAGAPPYPAGGLFAAEDLRGRWTTSGAAFGGIYYNTVTGGFAGAAVLSSGGHFFLNDDGTYDYSFTFASSHPQFGNSGGTASHAGRYRLNGDIVLVEPSKPLNYSFTCCAVGIGLRQTPQGPRRVLITVSANRDGEFRAPPLIPDWDSYEGVMTWYVEEPARP